MTFKYIHTFNIYCKFYGKKTELFLLDNTHYVTLSSSSVA